MNPDLDTFMTALDVRVDDLLAAHPEWAPERPVVGFAPRLSDAELVTLAVLQALLGFDSEARFIRYATAHLRPWFPFVAQRPGYNKRLRRSGEMVNHMIGALARDCDSYHDDVWVVDSTPVQCGRSRETQRRSDLAGWAAYGYCASHSRWFWGLRLHLITAPSGLPVAHALTGAKATETPRPGRRFLRPLRQIIESVNWTLKSQLGLERHRGRTRPGVAARILRRLLALTAAIWHNETTQQPGPARSLIAYDH